MKKKKQQKRQQLIQPEGLLFQSEAAPIGSDVLGSWTGTPAEEEDRPVQDADDL